MYPRKEVFNQGNYYHIHNRGIDRKRIFFNDANYEFLIKLIKRYKDRYSVSILAYCLMPNHYHMLIRQDKDIPIYHFIRTLFNSYVQAVNKQQGRKGSLFEGRFQYVHVDKDEYLFHLCRYIHMNPVKAKLVSQPVEWPYSNYRDWVELRSGSLKDQDFIKGHFTSPSEYETFCNDGSWMDDQNIHSFLEKVKIE